VDTLLSKIQKLVVSSLSGTLAIVAVLSTLHPRCADRSRSWEAAPASYSVQSPPVCAPPERRPVFLDFRFWEVGSQPYN